MVPVVSFSKVINLISWSNFHGKYFVFKPESGSAVSAVTMKGFFLIINQVKRVSVEK